MKVFEGNESLPKVFDDSLEFNANNRNSKLAIVIIAWNIFKHFNLYNQDIGFWNDILKLALEKAAKDKNGYEFLETLKIMVAGLKDGQARAWDAKLTFRYALPFLWEWIDNKLYISKVSQDETQIKPGDEVIEINGENTIDVINRNKQLVSSSTEQWKIIRTLAEMRAGDEILPLN
jgi:hypothetical protein